MAEGPDLCHVSQWQRHRSEMWLCSMRCALSLNPRASFVDTHVPVVID